MAMQIIIFKCDECERTHADKLSAKLCTHDHLEGKTMPRAMKNGAPKTTKTKPAAKKTKVAKRKQKKKSKVS